MSTFRRFVVLAMVAVGLAAIAVPLPSAQIFPCESEGDAAEFPGCPGCATFIVYTCGSYEYVEETEPCPGCYFLMTASLTCGPGTGQGWSADEFMPCGSSIGYRFNECPPSGGAWGWVSCDCDFCPW